MAKKAAEETKSGRIDILNVKEESITDQIANANKYSEEIVKYADEIADEKEKKRMAEELNRIRDKATYVNIKSVLKTRLMNAQKRATDAFREATRDILAEVVSGKLTAVEYDTKITEQIKKTNESLSTASKQFDSDLKELRSKFPSSWSYDWDNPFDRLNV